MSDAERKACIKVLRSLATSRRDASLVDLVRDYGETEGGHIPFKKFGFGRLEDFLVGSGQFRLTPYGTVSVRHTEESSHIQRLVAEQKNNAKKRPAKQYYQPNQQQQQQHHYMPRPTSAQSQRGGHQQMQPSLYSRAIQNLKLRSPIKTNTNRSQSAGSNSGGGGNVGGGYNQQKPQYNHNYNNYNGQQQQHRPNNHMPQHNKSSVIPPAQPIGDKPSYVVTFSNGESVMRPDNELARQQSNESQQSGGSGGSGGQRKGQKSGSSSPKHQQQQQQQQQPRAITKNANAGQALQQPQQPQQQQQPKQHQQQHQQQQQQRQQQAQQPIDGGFDLRQRLDAKRNSNENANNTHVDLRHRLNNMRNNGANAAAAAASGPGPADKNGTQRLNETSASTPPTTNVAELLRQRLQPPQHDQQQQQQQQQQKQQPQKQQPPQKPIQSANRQSPESSAAGSSLSSRLQSRLKITAPADPPKQPSAQSPALQYNTISSSAHSPSPQQQQQQPPQFPSSPLSLNNRLARKVSDEQMQVPPPQLQPKSSGYDAAAPLYAPAFTPQQAPPSAADNITTLAIYCTNKRLAVPSYKIFKMPKTNRLQCRLMINGITYSSYPLDFEAVREAKLHTAGEALARLREMDVEEQYPLCMDLDSELVLKLYDCLKESPHGMFERNIPEHFQKTYRQSLPLHWTTLIVMSEHAQLFSVAESVQGNKIVHALSASDLQNRPASQPSSQSQTPISGGRSQQFQQPHLNVQQKQQQQQPQSSSALAIQQHGQHQPQSAAIGGGLPSPGAATNYAHMEPLQLPWSEKYWNLFITNPKSTVDVWARLIGPQYSDRMDNLIVDIELDLMHARQTPTTLLVGHIYLVVVSECTYRVRLDRNDFARKRCLCFYVDVGDEEWVAMDEIYVCKPQFLQFPAQAICLSLFGLEDCAENPLAPPHLVETLMNKTLIGDVASQRDEFEAQERSADEAAKVVVALYDTSSDEDVQLNSLILDRICAHSQPPQLDLTGVTNVVISHVTDAGDVYCQPLTMTGGIHYVQKLIHHITQFGFNPDHHRVAADVAPTAAPEEGGRNRQVLLVQDETDGKWYRARVLQRAAERCQVFYVDYGMTRTVATSKMYRLDSMCQVLHSYPFQAIVCKLHEVPQLSAGQLASLRGYLRVGVQAMVKITGLRQKVPVVKIFVRQRDGPLFTVNDVIQFEQEIESSAEDGAASPPAIWNAADVMPKSAHSSRPPSVNGAGASVGGVALPPPATAMSPTLSMLHTHQPLQPLAKCPTPAIGERFEVHVTMASNPHNFKVRPHRQVPHFQALMVELQEYCKRTPAYVPDDQVCIDQAYACQQPDNVWYRVVVQNLISNSMFLICYCDYGDIVVINSDRLKVLPASFRQLPSLAISARLSGVKPLNRDWETDDCLRFQRMTVDKTFVSRIDNILRPQTLNGSAASDEAILELTLIDVSTANDININQLLILEERAVLAPVV